MAALQPIEALADRVLNQLHAQRDLPRVAADPGSWLRRLPFDLPDLMLALLIAACLVAIGMTLFRLRRGKAGWDVETESAVSAAQGQAAHLTAAEAHAAAGRLVEAMHELLLQALADIRRHVGGRLDPSLTSREILRQAPLQAEGRAALGSIITNVEWTYFGLRPASEGAWEACRVHFQALRRTLDGAA
jgi:hypothetical protein